MPGHTDDLTPLSDRDELRQEVRELEATLKRLRGDRTYLASWIETNVPGAMIDATGERWRVERKQPTLEYRVVTKHRGHEYALVESCPSEQYAREWATPEREDYPHAEVWIERRAVGDWQRVDG